MVAFIGYADTLPDPNNSIALAGDANTTGTAGPGMSGVTVESHKPIMRDKANSGRLISRSVLQQYFMLKIKYNPLLQSEFNIIYSFLLHYQNTLAPFFVELPQYPSATTQNLTVQSAATAGSNIITTSLATTIAPGSLFTINDSADSNHLKTYMALGVEDENNYNTQFGAPAAGTSRIRVAPDLQKDVSSSATLNFTNPKMQVIQKDTRVNYAIDSEGLYSLSLNLEEVVT